MEYKSGKMGLSCYKMNESYSLGNAKKLMKKNKKNSVISKMNSIDKVSLMKISK